MDTESPVIWPAWCYTGDTTPSQTNGDANETPTQPPLKSRKRRLPDRMNGGSGGEYNNNNNTTTSNNNNSPGGVKNERLSPGTPDTLSRSRSVTPSSASYPGTPPGPEHVSGQTPLTHPAALPLPGRNYSDFMRSLAAKYNNSNPNDYFGSTIRNGYSLLKPNTTIPTSDSNSLPLSTGSMSPSSKSKPQGQGEMTLAAAAALLNPFASGAPPPFPPLIDMSTTQTLLAMVRTAKEAEIQGLLKAAGKRPHQDVPQTTTPLDLSATTMVTNIKRPRVKTPSSGKNSDSESPRPTPMNVQTHYHHPFPDSSDISSWTVDDVCNFVASIDICAEYAQKFREQRIDGAGLPLLTEEHLTNTMGLKLGPALKLRSLLARKTGSCSVCLHCVHCHASSDHTSVGDATPAPT